MSFDPTFLCFKQKILFRYGDMIIKFSFIVCVILCNKGIVSTFHQAQHDEI